MKDAAEKGQGQQGPDSGQGPQNSPKSGPNKANPQSQQQAKPQQPPPLKIMVAQQARVKNRHRLLFISFLLLVLAPILATAAYLEFVAKDQYASRTGFSVRKEEAGSAIELLGGITELSGSSSTDTDILFEFIQSQQMVRSIDTKLNLRAIYAQPDDPVFGLNGDTSIEDLLDYWNRMVKVYYDSGSGLIELRILAFDPTSAQTIAQAIFDESSEMINDLSAIARADATRYAEEELEKAVERLRVVRVKMTDFRLRTQILDPEADIQGRMGLLNNLQAQLAEAIIELDILKQTTQPSDPRVSVTERRVNVIRERLEEERLNFSAGGDAPSEGYAPIIAEYESLSVDLEFAQQAYVAALATYDTALAEAQRKSRYLAAYVQPTLAERSEYPQKLVILMVLTGFTLIGWATLALIYYSVRDRR